MTLQSSGAMAFGDINVELGVARTTARPLGGAAARALAGVASGAIRTAADFYGKSSVSVVFTPDGGTTAGTAVFVNSDVVYQEAEVIISCSQNATWTYTRTFTSGNGTEFVNLSTGGVGTEIIFRCDSVFGQIARRTWSLSATADGITRYWTIDLRSEYV